MTHRAVFDDEQLRQIAGMSKLEAERQMRTHDWEAAAKSFDLAALACRLHGDPRSTTVVPNDA